MESRNIVLAVLVVAVALGVFYMIDPTFGGLLSKTYKREYFEDVPFNVGTGPNSMAGQPTNLFPNGEEEANSNNANPNLAANQQVPTAPNPMPNVGRNVAEGFDNPSPSPMPFTSAEKPANCYPKNQLAPQELLPNDPNSKWAQVNPMGAGDISGKNFLNAGALIGVNTVGSSLRNASWDIRSEPPNPQVVVSPWLNSTIEPDLLRRPLEIG